MITAMIVGVLVIAALVFGFYSGAMSARRELADHLAMARQDQGFALIRTIQEANKVPPELNALEQGVQMIGFCTQCGRKLEWPADGGEGT